MTPRRSMKNADREAIAIFFILLFSDY